MVLGRVISVRTKVVILDYVRDKAISRLNDAEVFLRADGNPGGLRNLLVGMPCRRHGRYNLFANFQLGPAQGGSEGSGAVPYTHIQTLTYSEEH